MPTKTKGLLPALVFATTLLFCSSSNTFAQRRVPLWTNNFVGGTATGVAVDGSGNVFVCEPVFSYDYATIKYSSAGTPLWTNFYNGPASGYDYPRAIALDKSGNVFVTGSSEGTDLDFLTLAYSGAGIPLWTNRYSGPSAGNDDALALAMDSGGNVFAIGPSGVVADYATIKYSGAGTPLWTNSYAGSGSGSQNANEIAVDKSGNAIVTGYDAGYMTTIKYSGAGVPLWTNRYSEGASSSFQKGDYAVAVDSGDNIIVTGPESAAFGFQYRATIKYSGTGTAVWTNHYNNGSGGNAHFDSAIAVDASSNVFVTEIMEDITNNLYYATIKYSGAGTLLWTRLYSIKNLVFFAHRIAVDGGGNVFVSGSGGTIAYSGAGTLLWTNSSFGGAVTVDGLGNVIASGDFTVKFASSLPPPRLGFQLLNNELVLNWSNASFNLQSAPDPRSTFTNIPNATSPFTNPISGSQQFFRLIYP